MSKVETRYSIEEDRFRLSCGHELPVPLYHVPQIGDEVDCPECTKIKVAWIKGMKTAKEIILNLFKTRSGTSWLECEQDAAAEIDRCIELKKDD